MQEKEILLLVTNPDSFDRGFEMLFEKYKEPLYWQVRRMVIIHEDADDVIQNVFIKVYKNLNKFNQQSKLKTWLYRIAYNEAINHLNKKSKLTLEERRIEISNDPFFSGDEIQVLLHLAVDELPAAQKKVFLMRYYEELPYKEIAEVTGTSIGALKANYHHAVKKIEEFVKERNVYV